MVRCRSAFLPAVFAGALLLSETPAAAAGSPVAVIVHAQVPVDNLSLPELQRIFLGKRQFWSRDLTITLLLPPHGTREREVLRDKIYEQRSEVQVQSYWINSLFGDEAQATPKTTASNDMSVRLVRDLPGAIALVSANRIPKGVKVLRIGGKKPGEAGYPLTSSG